MFGRHTFSLNVHISIPNTRSDREMVFKASGSVSKTGQDWLFMQQTIKRPSDWAPSEGPGPHYVNIMVKGVRGLSYQSDIALDDLKFVPGPCPDKPPVVREVFSKSMRKHRISKESFFCKPVGSLSSVGNLLTGLTTL